MKEQKRQKLVIAAILAAMTICAAGCSSNAEETTANADAEQTTTTAVSSAAEETTTTTAAASEEAEESKAEESKADTPAAAGEFNTQLELLFYVRDKFGLNDYEKGSDEETAKKAKMAKIMGNDFDQDGSYTAEFLIRAVVTACDVDTDTLSMDEIVGIAVDSGIISDKDLSKVDLSKSSEIIDRAADIWANGKYDFSAKSKGGDTASKADADSKADTADSSAESKADKTISTDTGSADCEFKTQYDMLAYINFKFGIDAMQNKSVEENIKDAKKWHVIDDDFDKDAAPTAEFLVSAVVRAGSFADESNTMDEIIDIAYNKGIIDDKDISKIDLSKASKFIERGAKIWSGSAYKDEELDVTLRDNKGNDIPVTADGAYDLTGIISSSDIRYEDPFIFIPVEVAEILESGMTVKLPADQSGNGGGTYKLTSVAIVNSEATIRGDKIG